LQTCGISDKICQELDDFTNFRDHFANRNLGKIRTLIALLICCLVVVPNIALANSTTSRSFGYSDIPSIATTQVNTSSPIKFFTIPTSNSGPNAIISAPNDTFWFVEFTAGKLGEFFAQNDSFKEFPIPENNSIPSSLTMDSLGRIWFSDQSGNGSIWMFDPATDHFTQFDTLSPKSTPLFLIADDQNNIWFTESTANKLSELSYPGYKMTEYTLPTSNSGPVEITFGQNKSVIWITETYTGKIARFNVNTHTFVEYSPPSFVSLKSPVGIVVDGAGNVWVSEHGGSAVVELVPANSTFRSYPTSVPDNGYPISAVATLAIDAQGRLWFVEHFANKVGRLDPTTGIMEEFQIPSSLPAYSVLNTLDSQGNFWFTEFGSNQIGEVLSNVSSPLQTTIQPIQSNSVSSGDTIVADVTVSNTLPIPQYVTLNTTSSFSYTGLTSNQQISLNSSGLTLPADGKATISAKITPNASLSSGIYSIGIVASSGNSSTVGITFISVKGQFSIGLWIASNYQLVLVALILVLGITYVAVSRRPRTNRRKTKN
jgi:streptogramin lyase